MLSTTFLSRGQHIYAHEYLRTGKQVSTSVSQPTLLIGSQDGKVALVDARTGTMIWQRSSHRQVGTLVHAGEQFFVAWGSRLRLVHGPRRRDRYETRVERQRRRDRILAEPAWLEARSPEDGRLLWRVTEWNVVGPLIVGVNSDVVVAALTGGGYRDLDVHAFDRRTGRPLWTYPYPPHVGFDGRRFFVVDGRVYVYRQGRAGGLILDALTGEPLTGPDAIARRWMFAPGGHFALESHWPAEKPTVQVLDPKTGLVQAEWPLPGEIRAVTDSGIAYCSAGPRQHPSSSALRLTDGVLLWRNDEDLSRWCAVSDTTVFDIKGVHVPPRAIEVSALDAGTGEVLWRWQSPRTVGSLLALWGMRTPRMLAYSMWCIGATLAAAFAQRAPREIALTLRWELSYGQWRHPHWLLGGAALVAGWETVFVGTSLGVFALRASDGQLLWHALPTTDVSAVLLEPAPT